MLSKIVIEGSNVLKSKKNIVHLTQYYETDQMGVIHHANYVKWMEEARHHLLKSLDIDLNILEDKEIYMAVLSQNVNYFKIVKSDELIKITCNCIKISSVRINFEYEFYNVDKKSVCAKGYTSHCFVNNNYEPIIFKKECSEEYIKLEKLVQSYVKK